MNVLPGSVKDSTVDDYRYIIATYVTPHVGRHRLAKLTPEHVQAMMRALEDAGYSSRTRQYARAVLRRARGGPSRQGSSLATPPRSSTDQRRAAPSSTTRSPPRRPGRSSMPPLGIGWGH
jgi:Phage integrase central domain